MEPPNQGKKNPAKATLRRSEAKVDSRSIQDGAESLVAKIRDTTKEAKRVERKAVALHEDVERTEAALHDTEGRVKRVERKAAMLHNHIRSTRKRPQ